MSRVFSLVALLSLAACNGEVIDSATSTDPTVDFEIEIAGDGIDNDGDGEIDEGVVDTGWPSYTGSRRRSVESGWRTVPTYPLDIQR